MKKINLLLIVLSLLMLSTVCLGQQQTFYDVTPGVGNGIRFWQQDNAYKIHMGTGTEYQYGPVTDYSIKMNMSGGTPNRGWTWGIAGSVPVAAMNTLGQMQVAGDFTVGNITPDGYGKWMKVGPGNYASFPFNAGSGGKNGVATAWDSDGIFIGLTDEGNNRKDAIIAWGDDGDDMLRFLFNNAELVRIHPNGNMGIGTSNISSATQTRLRVFEPGSSTSTWRGRIVSSGDNTAVVMGEWNGKACLGGHNSALNAWSDLFIQFDGGNVGIGTQTATQKLHVNGSIIESAENSAIGIDAQSNARLGFVKKSGYGPMIASDVSAPIIFAQTNQTGIHTNIAGATLTERMRIDVNGNVGIGSTNPTKKLTVNGTIYGKEVQVDLNVPGPDYVFEKDYNLLSLEEVKNYIEENKHLPEVPSAKEMETNGINVGEMNMILLKKVEELTLHLIDQNKKLEAATSANNTQQKQIESLQKKIDDLVRK